MSRARTLILQVAGGWHRSLLWLYPREFRARFGSEIARSFSEMAKDGYESAGLGALIALEIRYFRDTVVSAWRERRESIGGHEREWSFLSVHQDLRYAVRYLARRPAFSLLVILILALGIGANTAIFSVVHATMLHPSPFAGGEDLVILKRRLAGGENLNFSLREADALEASCGTLEDLAQIHWMSFTLFDNGDSERVTTGVVSNHYFDLLGVGALYGRTFRADDTGAGVLVLSHDYWQRRFGSDADVVGRRVAMNDRDHTVIGVLPPLPPFPHTNDVFMPLDACPFMKRNREVGYLDARMLRILGKTAPGVTRKDAALEVTAILEELPNPGPELFGVLASPVQDELANQGRSVFLTLLAAVTFVLLIVCANVTNLTLARLVRRERELAVRTALGAGRGRLMRQMMAENLVLAAVGGVVGLGLAYEMLDQLAEYASRFSVLADKIRIDVPVLAFACGVVVVTGLLLGGLPGLTHLGIAHCRDLLSALRDGTWGRFLGHGGQRLQRLLVVVQLAVSFVLLIGAGLMWRSLVELQRLDPGFRTENVVSMMVDLNWSRYQRPDEYRAFFTALVDDLASRPGIELAAVAQTFPLHDQDPWRNGLWIEDRARDPDRPTPRVDVRAASIDYFATLGIELEAGRGFECGDDGDAEPVAIVNRSLARNYFGDEDPLGRRVSTNGEIWMRIVGVVGDVKQYGLASAVEDEIYIPLRQHAARVMMVLVALGLEPVEALRQD